MYSKNEMKELFLAGLAGAQGGLGFSSGIYPGGAETSLAMYIILTRMRKPWEYED